MAVEARIPVTAAGAAALKSELKRLKAVERPKVVEALAEARSHGDLSENADYEAAKDRQAFIEGRIAQIGDRLSRAEIVDVSKLSGDRVMFGATVTLADEDGTEIVYQIVGDIEADIKKARVGVSSPIARAMIGKEVGDAVVVRGPKGAESEYEIHKVEFVATPFVEEHASQES